ncbi:MAG: hypothetical protein A2015_13305 [Spirochaetes bacterium GWF1_31_7]|nr:MAG: hypothetical protein A2Y29_07225 [Spirochaetes bacterium GWE2_31_10]OHD49224.1 MAG: hypothetical protein A2015_13305 [Spirochaetes bacterium GWF1_31_7]HBD95476.1 hypothetical protein [Spirochaetia bacterium]
MIHKKTVAILVTMIAIASGYAASVGIFSSGGPGLHEFTSIHGKVVKIYGNGIYRNMSAEVAPQGIAQDYVTLFIAIPLLLIALFYFLKGSLRARFVLGGVLGYFLVTYMFYLAMAVYNPLFLVYTFLFGASFFALSLTLLSVGVNDISALFSRKTPVLFPGAFLIFNTTAIALLWLSIVVPPLLNGSIIPSSVEHYTTLIVQGYDLGLLLPLAAISGILLLRRKSWGFLIGPVYLVFLSLLMTALISKIIALGILGYAIIPAVFIIPVLALVSVFCSYLLLSNIISAVHTD